MVYGLCLPFFPWLNAYFHPTIVCTSDLCLNSFSENCLTVAVTTLRPRCLGEGVRDIRQQVSSGDGHRGCAGAQRAACPHSCRTATSD